MQLTRLSVTNWRNFRSVNIEVHRRLFIVGANASGKSNFLDALRFLGDIARRGGGLASAIDSRGGLKSVRNLNAGNFKGGRVSIEVDLKDGEDTWSYSLSIKSERSGHHRPIVAHESVVKNDLKLLERPSQEDVDDSELLTQTHLEQIAANKRFRVIAEYFASITYFHLSPQSLRETAGSFEDDEYGRGFLAAINAEQKHTRDAWLARIQTALSAAVPEFESLTLETDSAGRPHLVAGYRHWRKDAAKQRETEFSDGTLRLIGLLWTVISNSKSSRLLLLEEPELSLNASIVRVLPTMFASAQRAKDMQIAMTTHSPDLLDDEGVNPNEIVVLRVKEGDHGTSGTLLSDIEEAQAELAADLPISGIVDGLINPRILDPLIEAMR